MTDHLNIPLLQDLVSKGQPDINPEQQHLDSDENQSLEIEQEEMAFNESLQNGTQPGEENALIQPPIPAKPDNLSDDASVRELIIDEEIRMILDKHMDNAYEEIIRLLNHRIS